MASIKFHRSDQCTRGQVKLRTLPAKTYAIFVFVGGLPLIAVAGLHGSNGTFSAVELNVKEGGTVDEDCDACRAGYRNAYPKIASNRIDVVETAIKISVEDTGFRFREGVKCWDLISDGGVPTPVGSTSQFGIQGLLEPVECFHRLLCVLLGQQG